MQVLQMNREHVDIRSKYVISKLTNKIYGVEKWTNLRQDHGPWNRSVDLGPQTNSMNQTMKERVGPQVGPRSMYQVHRFWSTYPFSKPNDRQDLRTVDRYTFHGPGRRSWSTNEYQDQQTAGRTMVHGPGPSISSITVESGVFLSFAISFNP